MGQRGLERRTRLGHLIGRRVDRLDRFHRTREREGGEVEAGSSRLRGGVPAIDTSHRETGGEQSGHGSLVTPERRRERAVKRAGLVVSSSLDFSGEATLLFKRGAPCIATISRTLFENGERERGRERETSRSHAQTNVTMTILIDRWQ